MEGGGGASYAAQEPRDRERQRKEVEEKGRADGGARGGAGMKFRVSARAPHGVGALLLIGGAVLAGAAVVAWRHARRGKRGGGDEGSRERDRQPAKQESLDGGVVDDGKSGAPAQEIDRPRPDDNPRGEEEKTEIASNGLDNGGVTSEIEEVHEDAEIVADELFQSSERVEEKIDLDSGTSPTEISMHEDVDSAHVEKIDQNSSSRLSEATTHDTDNEIEVEKGDENSTKDDPENNDNSTKNNTDNDDNSTKNDIQNDEDSVTNHIETEDLSKDDLKEEMTPNDNEDVEASDQCSLSISRPVIVLDKQPSLHTDCAQEAESMENSPTAQLMMHQEQLLDDMTMDTEAETAEAKLGEGTVVDKDVCKQEEQKEIAEPVELAGSPALSSLVKPAEKKQPELPARIETGMKIEQDYTNGGLKNHGRISRGGAITTMDRRSPSMAILALMFVLTVGIAIAVRLYAPPRATKLQIDLQ
ncbi:hypothetical protein EJB05_01209 [Eragrostis curvula]|uniref:Uncharacterized protein n=1 Tax=Eragrostis curvula TaxID=38414 RepID=A0A5J9WRC0_9POAL|nr:hypothetical protein EJB05_01209 [Eragrostis curvula]